MEQKKERLRVEDWLGWSILFYWWVIGGLPPIYRAPTHSAISFSSIAPLMLLALFLNKPATS